MSQYEHDFYAWTQAQAAALRAKDWAALDLEHVAEEIESMGKRDRRAVESTLVVRLGHGLQWVYPPERRSASWRRRPGPAAAGRARRAACRPAGAACWPSAAGAARPALRP